MKEPTKISRPVTGQLRLRRASEKGHTACVKLLVDAKANTDLQSSDGMTALIKASSEGHQDCVKHLLDARANKNLKTKNGNTALNLAKTQEIREILSKE